MSNRFVSGGTISSSGDDRPDQRSAEETGTSAGTNAQWEAVQKQLDAERQQREESRRKAIEGGERSLYDVLQENKAAKEAAFAEQAKLSNQFQMLNEDDVDFLDEVREKKRQEEERLRKETEEGLKRFREQQKGGGDDGDAAKQAEENEAWAVGVRKRKRKEKEGGLGVKKKLASDVKKNDREKKKEEESEDGARASEDKTSAPEAEAIAQNKKPSLSGLVSYDSDDSD
ncbi:N-terminal domain of NEFA-interacting nuclear protein NIP30-domain-containing protein [Emericellopsis atlantica]|uniref:N-terminal domain of NEFA-interacting nuclear protein NIP30-domain-containing protein n=1 Tax=Emericellopsis atlantica TaxID=2614577 RepID=A0A9P7ZN22_9HYPO|nr:N-terminal domain of NEFA-interacting nuclear protein NIP30-domain-containing protein [Emericellopsis atlantica]KAG9255139.1 N-terminal domain of NEFA-interacting nuclear protein NIP30-domain-containing protein [Emericellopsis atlantica]